MITVTHVPFYEQTKNTPVCDFCEERSEYIIGDEYLYVDDIDLCQECLSNLANAMKEFVH